MAESGPNIAPFLDLAVQIIQASGGDTKRADEAAHILASSTAVNSYPAVDGLVKALEGMIGTASVACDVIDDRTHRIDCTKKEWDAHVSAAKSACSALSRFRSLQNGGANE